MSRFDLVAYLTPKLTRARLKGNELTGACPLPDHQDNNPSFSINVNTGAWICRSVSCGKRGGLVSLISKIEKISFKDAAAIAQVRMPLYSNDDFEELVGGIRTPKRAPVFSKLPACAPAVDCYPEYLVSRRYPKESGIAEAFDLRIGMRGRDDYNGKFQDYLILPVYDHTGLNYLSFTARYMGRDPNKPRYDGPSDSIKNYLYGEWLLRDEPSKPIYIVEGQFDVFRLWTFGESVLGTFGTSYTHAQVRRLCSLLGSRRAVVCFDEDATSHEHDNIGLEETHSKPLELVSTLVSLGVPTIAMAMPKGIKDPDSYDAQQWLAASRSMA